MPIAIATTSSGVTITESPSWFGRAYDGITAAFKGDHVTGKEHQASMIVGCAISLGVGSYMGRKNQAAGKAPVLGYFL